MLELILKSLYFFLPAYIANLMPNLLMKVKVLDISVHEKWFGKNKTWRGIVIAILSGGLIFFLQKLLHSAGFVQFSLIDYNDFSILLGFLLGLGVILGDLIESYFKRRAGVKPGKPWFPWDQLDFVIGGITFSFFIFVPPAEVVLVLLIVSPILHILTNRIGYWIGLNKEKW